MNGNVFVCLTYHHVLISCIKAMRNCALSSIVLTDELPGREELSSRLQGSGIFQQVFYIPTKRLDFNVVFNGRMDHLLYENKRIVQRNQELIPLNFHDYKNVYIFNDWSSMGRYLQASHVRYHLIEDAADYYKVVPNFVPSYHEMISYTFRQKIKQLFGIGFWPFGAYKGCLDVEVNDRLGVHVPKQKKIIVMPKLALYSGIKPQEVDKLNFVFLQNLKLLDNSKKSILILTQPLFKDGLVSSLEKQFEVYSAMIERIEKMPGNNAATYYLKPHPRDDADYASRFPGMNVIEKTIPTEIFNFNKELFFDEIATVCSSAIYTFTNVRRKIWFGFEFLHDQSSEPLVA